MPGKQRNAANYRSKEKRFRNLMWHRVREVLLVSSPYDAFILQQDIPLTEQADREYSSLHLSTPPRFTHVPTGAKAIRQLEARRFDLVMAMTSLSDMRVNAFGRKVKALRPGRPVVLLALDRKEVRSMRRRIDTEAIDGVFLWNGDPRILLAINHFIEDRENVEADVRHGNIKVIIVVEDDPAYYSAFLGLLYHELMEHADALYQEGLNPMSRRTYMQSRPKVLLATSFEKGLRLYKKYHRNTLAIISDVGLPRGDGHDKEAGLEIVRRVRRKAPDLPIILQSAQPDFAKRAEKLGVGFIEKGSQQLLEHIRSFLIDYLGFGPFLFRMRDGGPMVGRAEDLQELEERLLDMPEASLRYHARHDHFSIWLGTRSEFELAERVRPVRVEDFDDIDDFRNLLRSALREARRNTHRGLVADFDRRLFDRAPFVRLGRGSLGGKARGLAFLHRLLAEHGVTELAGLEVAIPKTVVLTTEHFDAFLEHNALRQFALTTDDDDEIDRRFRDALLPTALFDDLRFILRHMECPLAVRSSSLLEDSRHQRLAGIYDTFMLPNNGPWEQRLKDLTAAIQRIYASTFLQNARTYLRRTGRRLEEDKMAVVIQELVGQRFGNRFYPMYSGVAQSYNFYPIREQKPEDGVVLLALGFGRQVVEGGLALRFNPKNPEELPQLGNPKLLLDRSQRRFFALDLERTADPAKDLNSTLQEYDLSVAEDDGALALSGSVYSPEDRMIRDGLDRKGPRLITFNNILKHRAINLAEALGLALKLGSKGFGESVEIELAGDMGDWGRRPPRGRKRREPRLYLLQIRPFLSPTFSSTQPVITLKRHNLLVTSKRCLGHGVDKTLHDLIYVREGPWTMARNRAIAQELGQLNRALDKERRRYVLIGPGRWGTSDPSLGVPAQWNQICAVKAIIETAPPGRSVEPSQGSHFFQNLTALEIAYFTLGAGLETTWGEKGEVPAELLDQGWLDEQEAFRKTENLRHLRFEKPLVVLIDGRRGVGQIVRPGSP